ncbi:MULTISPECIES: endo-1,4-beta-xylanase [unclassified Rhizobium]|uniref:endo-1,4-beta-xylanase n=1 Tax=unclassified Rhizobium TaxID=2613769 RepID=UPI0013C4688A|nr:MULTISPECIES: endo-1,4-beta-xylanase [unclassified Rhizobium]
MQFLSKACIQGCGGMTRRALLKTAAAGAGALAFSSPTVSAQQALRSVAERKGLIYGAATAIQLLQSDQGYADLVASQAGMLVAEGHTKRASLQPDNRHFSFANADALLQFADTHQQRMRGHTLVWHRANPDWLETTMKNNPDERLLTDYIAAVCTRYKGRFHSWDVVNEPVDPDQGHPDGLRTKSIWYQAFGERYIDIAFHAARQADPGVKLYLNETTTEANIWWSQARRTSILKLIDRLLARNVPINGFGMEAHLAGFGVDYSQKVIADFVRELTTRGLEVLVTELDISDRSGPRDPLVRDTGVASLTKLFLDAVFSVEGAKGCLTWGISDKYSWLSVTPRFNREDGLRSRGLPFDENFKPKPMFDAMVAAYSNAPDRRDL